VETHANEALQHDPAAVRARALLGRMHLAYNRYAEAELQIARAIDANPNDAEALAARGNVLLWLGRTEEAIDTLQLAVRIDPELNAFDRFALCMAYFLKGRYDDAIEQGEINLRKTPEANFNLVVLAAAYAQAHRPEDVARTVAELKRRDPLFDAATFGNKFQNPRDLARLREGLANAGLYSPAG
jgi:tetratricopeptide (TPR) repeat protein